MAYRVYYGNGAIHSSDDGTPPARGVQVIVQTHPDVGLHTQSGYDFYLRRDSRWVGVDRAGLFADMEDRGVARFNIGIHHYVMMNGEWVEVDEFGLYRFIEETGYALFGETLTQEKFYKVMTRAVKDMGDEKLGWLPDERRIDG